MQKVSLNRSSAEWHTFSCQMTYSQLVTRYFTVWLIIIPREGRMAAKNWQINNLISSSNRISASLKSMRESHWHNGRLWQIWSKFSNMIKAWRKSFKVVSLLLGWQLIRSSDGESVKTYPENKMISEFRNFVLLIKSLCTTYSLLESNIHVVLSPETFTQ